MAEATQPDWILILDADEIFEDRIMNEIKGLLARDDIDVWSFRLYDMWKPNYYREDDYWCAHQMFRPLLVRWRADFTYTWQEKPQHCGRLPNNIYKLPLAYSSIRLKHLGWMKADDRIAKYERYQQFDPEGHCGIQEQYDSILDPNPTLIQWQE